MKKICSILLALVLLIVPMTLSVSAAGDINANEQKIITELKKELEIGNKKFALPKEYVTQAENYLKTVDVNEAQANEIIGYIEDGEEILIAEKITGTTDLKTLPVAAKQQILDLGKKAVAVTGATLTFDGKNVVIKNAEGKVVFDAAPVVKQTGAEVDFTAIALSVLAVVAILGGAIVVAKKKSLFVK
ncbi:MAG: hypothetical protein J6Q74_02015 [Clostridia bacterium]|nr:hypothetical protein [Clostridia bacterium]